MEKDYVFIVNADGVRQTSYLVGIHGDSYEEIETKAKKDYPDCKMYRGGQDMQDEFLAGKAFDGKKFFVPDAPASTRTKAEEIEIIEAEYEPRFQRLRDAIMQRTLIGGTYADIQAQYKKLTAEMAIKIKAVK